MLQCRACLYRFQCAENFAWELPGKVEGLSDVQTLFGSAPHPDLCLLCCMIALEFESKGQGSLCKR